MARTITVAEKNIVLDFDSRQFTKKFIAAINPFSDYLDNILKEDIYSVDTIDTARDEGAKLHHSHMETLDVIDKLCRKHKAAYFRIIFQ